MSLAGLVVAAAISALGKPYAWGAVGPGAFDCSGLVVWSYQHAGITVPRTSQAQAQGGQPVPRSQLQPGDIIVYYPDASHVGLYIGDGYVIHASTYGVPVAEVPIDAAGPYNQSRRYLQGRTVTLYGPDISNNNWNSVTQLQQFIAALPGEGFSWVEAKCSEGNYYRDPFWAPTRDACKSIGLPCVAYHYVTTNDPASQARTFVANGGGSTVMLDFEANSGDIGNFWAVVNAFNAAGVQVVLSYIPHWYWQDIGSPDLTGVPGLISSAYNFRGDYASTEYAESGGANGVGWQPYGNAKPVIWQFTDSAIVAGVPVDCNAFEGTPDQLNQLLAGGTVAQPSNPPAIPKPADPASQTAQIWDQLLIRWDMLSGHTAVEALALIGQKLGIPGFAPPR